MKHTIENNGLRSAHNELIKAQTIIECTVPQLDLVLEYLRSVGLKSPAASVYAAVVLQAMDKLSDAATIIIGVK